MFLNALCLKKVIVKELIDAYFLFDSIPGQYKTQEMCDRVVSEDSFL